MVNRLMWAKPTEDIPYDKVRIYRAATSGGSYSLIDTVPISDIAYTDSDGVSTDYYKISFYDSTNAVESDKSTAMTISVISNYTTIRKVFEHLNWYNEADSEAVATGDSTTKVFTLDYKKVVDGTIVVYLAGVAQAIDRDYLFDSDKGRIEFLSAPGVVAITADYWYSTNLASSVVYNFIKRAEAEINAKLGRSFYGSASVTESYDGDSWNIINWYSYEAQKFKDLADDYRPLQAEFKNERTLFLNKWPVLTVTSFTIDSDALTSADYDLLEDEGIIYLHNDSGYTFTKGVQNVDITYTYGYTEVPDLVEELCIMLVSIRMIETSLIGTPPASLEIPYGQIRVLRQEVDSLYEALGRKLVIHVV